MKQPNRNIFFLPGLRTRHWPALLSLFISAVVLVVLSIKTEGFFGGLDDIHHYRISRYAPVYPWLFLDIWGRPVYTLLSTPFAQPGYETLKLFNVLIALLSSGFIYWLARKEGHHLPWVSIPLLIFTPIYLVSVPTALTEPVFGFVALAGLVLLADKRYNASAIVFSFLPFARTEGIGFLPFFMIIFLLLKKWRAVFLVMSGSVIISIAGSFYHHDLFWLLDFLPFRNPSSDIYGSGDFFFYFKEYKAILGPVVSLLFIAGIFITVHKALSVSPLLEGFIRAPVMIMAVGMAMIFILGHSYVWWKGSSGSLGLIRVMAGIAPLVALIASEAISAIFIRLRKMSRISSILFIAILLPIIIATPFYVHTIPTPISEPVRMMRDVSSWIKSNNLDNRKIYSFDPMVFHYLDIDANDSTRGSYRIPSSGQPHRYIEPGSIVVWDAHIAVNEAHIPLGRMMDNAFFRVIRSFQPEYPFIMLGGHNYEIILFERLHDSVPVSVQSHGYEFPGPGFEDMITGRDSTDGINIYRLDKDRRFIALSLACDTLQMPEYTRIILKSKIFRNDGSVPFSLVISFRTNGEIYRYFSLGSESVINMNVSEWKEVSLDIMAPDDLKESSELYAYIQIVGETNGEILVSQGELRIISRQSLD